MITEEKIKQVRKKLRSGEPEGELKNRLREEGYTTEDLEEIFTAHRPDMRSWYLFFAVLFFLIGIYTIMANGYILFLLFSAAMFYVYFLEIKRLKKIRP
jgi:hypothetical protein